MCVEQPEIFKRTECLKYRDWQHDTDRDGEPKPAGTAEASVAGYLNVRQLLHALSDALADHLERATTSAEYYDQESSPLPPHTHALLVRTGLVPGFKVARRVLVKRKDLHAYIELHKVEPNVASTTPDSEAAAVEQLLGRAGVRKTA